MIAIFEFEFMRKAFLVGMLIAVTIPFIGTTIVLKRLSMIGDALSHSSLCGVGFGLLFGINPVFGAVISCVIAAIGVETIRKKLQDYSDVSIAIITSAGVGLAGILSGFVKNSSSFNSFLFGSIVSISNYEVIAISIVSILVIFTSILLYRELMHIAFDEESAKLAGINVEIVNFIFIILTAVTVSIASRTVGALIVSSIMVIPVATAIQIATSYKKVITISIIYAVVEVFLGLTLSYYLGLKSGGTIVIISVIFFVLTAIFKPTSKK